MAKKFAWRGEAILRAHARLYTVEICLEVVERGWLRRQLAVRQRWEPIRCLPTNNRRTVVQRLGLASNRAFSMEPTPALSRTERVCVAARVDRGDHGRGRLAITGRNTLDDALSRAVEPRRIRSSQRAIIGDELRRDSYASASQPAFRSARFSWLYLSLRRGPDTACGRFLFNWHPALCRHGHQQAQYVGGPPSRQQVSLRRCDDGWCQGKERVGLRYSVPHPVLT